MALLYEKKEKIAYFTINRPEAFNSLDPDTLKEFHDALLDFRDDPELWVGIVTGAGNRAFCAGADLTKTIPIMMDPNKTPPYRAPANIMRGLQIFKPLIAAINGMALGGGLEVALGCDLRVASEKATLGSPEVKWSIIPGWGATQRLPRFIPWAKAAEIMLMAQNVDAQEAYRIGLVNKVVPPDQVLPTATEWANKICELGPLGVRAAKEAMVRGASMPLEDGLRLEEMLFESLRFTEDGQEGIKAFAQKRKPEYKAK